MRSKIIKNMGTAKGRGVYAGRAFAVGEMVEEAGEAVSGDGTRESVVKLSCERGILLARLAVDPATHPVVESQPRAIARSALCPMMRA